MDNNTKQIRVLIADDHPVFREGLRLLIELDPKLCVVGEARDGKEATQLTRELNPDLLLLDLRMPRCSGLDALTLIQQLSLPVRVLVLATEIEKPDILEVLKRGASGIILKESTTELLRKSIHAVISGQYWLERDSISDLIVELTRRPEGAASAESKDRWCLTPRERQIVSEIVAGKTNKEIASELNVSMQTVKHHLTNIFDKIGVHNRLELALFSVHHSLGNDKPEIESPVQAAPPPAVLFPQIAKSRVTSKRVSPSPVFLGNYQRSRN